MTQIFTSDFNNGDNPISTKVKKIHKELLKYKYKNNIYRIYRIIYIIYRIIFKNSEAVTSKNKVFSLKKGKNEDKKKKE